MMYNRDKVAFTRLFGPGFHIEGEKYILDKRFKTSINKHNRYFGPRGEIIVYLATAYLISKFLSNNFLREDTVESFMNDRNVYLRVDLPLSDRLIK